MKYLAGLIGTAALLAPSLAWACGGFFCSTTPIDQSAERILFAKNPDGTIESHVQIIYQGEAADFAWVVPVPTIPDLFLSTDELFNQLQNRTRPFFWLDYNYDENCEFDWRGCGGGICAFDANDGGPRSAPASGEESGGVEVIAEAQVGPYDTAILRADDTALLLDWLQENSYLLPDELTSVLEPYVAGDSYFVALKLQNDKDAGDIEPLGMRYRANSPAIPIQLTSIAATPDMRLEVYLLGQHRGVPDNYLHVRINEAAINWLTGGSNYEDVITVAANEAGGQAFATDYAGSTAELKDMLYSEGRFDLDGFENVDVLEAVNELLWRGLPRNGRMQAIIRDHIPVPNSITDAGITDTAFYNCMSCYPEDTTQAWRDAIDFDATAMKQDILNLVVDPIIEADKLVEAHPYLTRLTSSISPVEMTLDPSFVFNPDMGDQSNEHRADLHYMCEPGQESWKAPRRIELADGRTILLPPEEFFWEGDVTTDDYLAGLSEPAAAIIESTAALGAPTLVLDQSDQIDRSIGDHNQATRELIEGEGCGCQSATGLDLLWMFGFAAPLLRRRFFS